jgi:hypothetical protein
MIEVVLLFCFVAILSAVVSGVRGIAMVLGIVTRPLRQRFRVNISDNQSGENIQYDPRSDHAVDPRNRI